MDVIANELFQVGFALDEEIISHSCELVEAILGHRQGSSEFPDLGRAGDQVGMCRPPGGKSPGERIERPAVAEQGRGMLRPIPRL